MKLIMLAFTLVEYSDLSHKLWTLNIHFYDCQRLIYATLHYLDVFLLFFIFFWKLSIAYIPSLDSTQSHASHYVHTKTHLHPRDVHTSSAHVTLCSFHVAFLLWSLRLPLSSLDEASKFAIRNSQKMFLTWRLFCFSLTWRNVTSSDVIIWILRKFGSNCISM